MLSKVIFFIFISSSTCFLLVPKFLDQDDIEVSKSSLVDCGDDTSSFHVTDATLKPDPLLFPGNLTITATTKVLKDLPEKDVEMRVNLKRVSFPPLAVPCVNNMGSW